MTDIIQAKKTTPLGYHYTNAGILPNEWTSRPLSSIVKEITETAGTRKIETVSISAGVGFVNQAEKFGKELSGKQYEKYTVLHRGDFSYNKGNSNLYPQGCIYRLNDRTEAAVPNVFESFRVSDGNPDFYEQLFISGFLNRQLHSRINRGVRDDGLLNLRGKDFYSCEVPCPPLAEQERIAEILMQCDKVIELKQKRIEEEKKKKIWLYRRILTGKTRLKGYETPWVETTIGEQVEYLVGYPFVSASFLNDGIKLLRGSNVKRGNLSWGTDITAYWSEDSSISDYLCQEGDIVIAMDGAQVGRSFSCIGNNDLPCYLVQRVARLRSNINGLIVQWIGGSRFARHIDQRKTSTAIPHMTIKDILSYEISIPTDEKEIEHISQLLNQQDQFIDLLEKEMNELCNRKASLAKLLLTGIVRTKV